MHYITLLLAISLLFSVSLALPIPSECACKQTPLSPQTIKYVDAVTKARPLTKDECNFICNPSPGAQQVLGSEKSHHTVVIAANTEPSTVPVSNAAKVAAYRNANLKAKAKAGFPLAWDPTRSPAKTVSRITGFRSHTESTLSPFKHGGMLPFVLQLLASLALLFILAVCVVEVGDMLYMFLHRRSCERRARSNSGSGPIRLEDGVGEKVGEISLSKGFKTVRWQ